ncbi:hypothetical protein [Halomonas halodenitrificans]|uniref:hypothetical protein n=1 Tax=Halomonas halodenitrificans TaxID=28252 RepID=UPI0012EC84D6|nr:hypothetical protein [Halomonas halodenitrificans]
MRDTGLPFNIDGDWVVWDKVNDSVAVSENRYNPAWCNIKLVIPKCYDKYFATRLMARSFLSNEYSIKPILLRSEHISAAKKMETVPFETPAKIHEESYSEYELLTYLPSGDFFSLPLKEACAKFPIVSTRAGIYKVCDDKVVNLLDYPSMLGDAFLLNSVSQESLRYFIKKDFGTVFDPCFTPIYRIDEGVDFLNKVYVTSGYHPLNFFFDRNKRVQNFVSSLDLVSFAKKTLSKHGVEVKIERKNISTESCSFKIK